MTVTLSNTDIESRLRALNDGHGAHWRLVDAGIERDFAFVDFHHTMAFVNAVAFLAHKSDHHPDMAVGYNRCRVRYTTHSAGGLTMRDFDAAASVNRL